MAILFRTLSALTVDGMGARLTVYQGGGRIRVELAPYQSSGTAAYADALQATVTYNGVSASLTRSAFTTAASANFEFSPDVRQLTLSAVSVAYRGTTAASRTISWKGDGTVEAPTVSVASFSGLRIGQPCRFAWAIDHIPTGYVARTVGLWRYFAPENEMNPAYIRTQAFSGKSTMTAYEHTISDLAEGNLMYYKLAVALYASAAEDAEDFVAYTELDTPSYLCSGEEIATLAPCNLRYPSSVARGRPITIRWELLAAATSTASVTVQYSYNGRTGVWYDVCTIDDKRVTSTTFTVTDASWTNVAFRIYATSTRSKFEKSGYCYGENWSQIGASNVYVGRGGIPVHASAVQIGAGNVSDGAYSGGYASVGA